MRIISLAGFLFAFWLALSGHYTPMLLVAGAACTGIGVLAALRMRVADAEGHPIELFMGAVTYFPWLIREIAKSAWAVTKVVLHPRLPISPTMTVVRASQKTAAGIATPPQAHEGVRIVWIVLTSGTVSPALRSEYGSAACSGPTWQSSGG
jgi:multicomponent Na+:H+ antiporter subunit E